VSAGACLCGGMPSTALGAAKEAAGHARGRVKWFDPDRGYGFIRSEQGEECSSTSVTRAGRRWLLRRHRGSLPRHGDRSRPLHGDGIVDRRGRRAGVMGDQRPLCGLPWRSARTTSASASAPGLARHGAPAAAGAGRWMRSSRAPGRARSGCGTRRAASGSCAAPTPPIRRRRGWWRSRRTSEDRAGHDLGLTGHRMGPRRAAG
jgi:hypothetical protein